MIRLMIALLLLLSPATALADPFEGRWVSLAEDRVVFSLTVEGEGDDRRVEQRRAEQLQFSSTALVAVEGPMQTYRGGPGSIDEDILSVTLANDGGEEKSFTLQPAGNDLLLFRFAGNSIAPLILRRSDAPVGIAAATKMPLSFDRDYPSNPEMRSLFVADQSARQGDGERDWFTIAAEDAKRRERVLEILRDGRLLSGEDFYHAAFIFQHGEKPDDYLLAHVMATASLARGYEQAAWISAATLDRYLLESQREQIFGTQMTITIEPDGERTSSMRAYNDGLLHDTLRMIHGVPPLERQQDNVRKLRGE